MSKISKTFVASILALSLLGGTAVLAEGQTGQPEPAQAPASGASNMHGMTQGGDMNQMMGMMGQMMRMMTNCNNMMESMMKKDGGSGHSDGENGPS
jgi:hypothetical protein